MRRLVPLLAATLSFGCSRTWPPPDVAVVMKPANVVHHHGKGVLVHLETGDPLVLTAVDGSASCKAPCDTWVPTFRQYTVSRSDWSLVAVAPFLVDVPDGSWMRITVGPTAPYVPSGNGLGLNFIGKLETRSSCR